MTAGVLAGRVYNVVPRTSWTPGFEKYVSLVALPLLYSVGESCCCSCFVSMLLSMTVRYAYRAVYASEHMPGLFEKIWTLGRHFFLGCDSHT